MLELFQHKSHLTLKNQNYTDEGIKTRLISGNAYCCSVQNLLSSHLRAKNVTVIISLLSISTSSCCSHLEHRASVKTFVSLQFLNPRTAGRTPWTGDQPDARPLPTQKQNKRRQISMPWVGFEPTIPVFQRSKAFHALDGAATVIGLVGLHETIIFLV
jgi:hypothetical protein